MKLRWATCCAGVGVVACASTAARADPPSPIYPPPLEAGQHFVVDPVTDGVLSGGSLAADFLLGEVLSTGEIKPPEPTVPVSSLLPIDRIAVTQSIDPHANTYSNIGLYTAIGLAVLDSVLSAFRDGTDAMVVDALMYAESGAIALTLTDVTKIAVRRPRPIEYIDCPPVASSSGGTMANPSPACSATTATTLGLSFWSGHSAGVAALGATATYLAFVRAPRGSPRPWITLGVATALTVFVSYERVRAGEHFPTDVIAGSFAGTAVGILVPHLHLHKQEAPTVWVGMSPAPGGGTLGVHGTF